LLYADGAQRVVTIEATYDSLTLGDDLPLNEEIRFQVLDLQKVGNG
jgi:hypothetical protein